MTQRPSFSRLRKLRHRTDAAQRTVAYELEQPALLCRHRRRILKYQGRHPAPRTS